MDMDNRSSFEEDIARVDNELEEIANKVKQFMKNLIEDLRLNSKIQKMEIKLKPSLSDDIEVEKVSLTIKTERPIIPLCKYIGIRPTKDLMYLVDFYCPNDPTKTLIKDLFEKYSQDFWVKPKYAHQNPMLNLKLDEDNLFKIINFIHSTIN